MKKILDDLQIVFISILLAICFYYHYENNNLKEEVYNQQEAINSLVESNYLDKDSLLLVEANKLYKERYGK